MAARLNDAHARNAKPKEQPYKLTDGHGLFLLVMPNGTKAWRYRYELGGKENLFAIGNYPDLSLRQAREHREQARALVKRGIHPSHQRRADRLTGSIAAANTFEAVAREWIDQQRNGWTPYYLKQVETMLSGDVFPHLGKLPIKEVQASQLLAILKRVAARGAPNVAILIRQWCSAIFRYAVATLRADNDASAALKGAISRPKVQHKKPLGQKDFAKFLARTSAVGATSQVRIALRLLLLTFVRPGELRCATWQEFNLEAAEWRIPAERMKMREPHIVPLSTQAVSLLDELRAASNGNSLLFPNNRDSRRPISPTTLNRALERMGYAGKFSAHGFRATASTMLNERGYQPDVIERQLAHRERNMVRASYNHATYLPERRRMMQEWADFIEAQRDGAPAAASAPSK